MYQIRTQVLSLFKETLPDFVIWWLLTVLM